MYIYIYIYVYLSAYLCIYISIDISIYIWLHIQFPGTRVKQIPSHLSLPPPLRLKVGLSYVYALCTMLYYTIL